MRDNRTVGGIADRQPKRVGGAGPDRFKLGRLLQNEAVVNVRRSVRPADFDIGRAIGGNGQPKT